MNKKLMLVVFVGFLVIFGVLATATRMFSNAKALSQSSLLFDGVNDYLRGTNVPRYDVFTVEAWVKRNADTGRYESFLSDANSGFTQNMFTLFVDGGSNDCGADQFAYFQITSSGSETHCSGVVAQVGVWYHVAVVRDASGRRTWFVNGNEGRYVVNSTTPADSSGRLAVGRSGDCNCEYFPGNVAMVRYSNTVRYANNFSTPNSFLVDQPTQILYLLDDGSGQTARDSSTYKRNAVLGGSTSNQSSDPVWSLDLPGAVQTTPNPRPTVISSPIPSLTNSPLPTLTQTPTPSRTPTPSVPTSTPLPTPVAGGGNSGYAMRFFGNGTGDVDRVKIPVDGPETKMDLGTGSFTVEAWLRPDGLDINRGSAVCSGGDGWINGNIIFDRDIFASPDYGDFGVSLGSGRVVFGVAGAGGGVTVCGSTNIADGNWHHVAVVRDVSKAELRVYVDGVLDGVRSGAPTGDLSYRNGRTTQWPNDRFFVIGAEKHDYDYQSYPSYSGLIDELRISNNVRYSQAFSRPTSTFTADSTTVVLYRFNEGSGTVLVDSASSPLNGTIKYGNGSRQSLPVGPQFVQSTVPLN